MNEKIFKKLDYAFGWLTFVIAAVVYLMTVEPTVSFWDCGEFISASNKLQVGHPPGAPFFLIIARLFAMFASGPEQVAIMINSFSAIVSAFTIMFLFWTIVYFAKRMIAPEKDYSLGKIIAIIGAGLIGALAYTFSDTFWFSAVEGEVYAFSSFFTAVVFWAMLKWSDSDDQIQANRWIILITLLIGMSIGVHLLNLLTIPALAFIFYFKNYKPNIKGFIITTLLSLFILAMIMWGIIPGVAVIASNLELFLVNTLGLPFNSGLLFWFLLVFVMLALSIYYTHYSENHLKGFIFSSISVALIGAPYVSDSIFLNIIFLVGVVWAIYYISKKYQRILNLIMLGFTMIMIGYSSYATIVIRSNANPPMDQNNPEDVFSLIYYLNREQYGDRPLMYGQYFTAEAQKYDQGDPIYVKRNNEYYKIGYKTKVVYDDSKCTVFPRMYSNSGEHIDAYKEWSGMRKTQTEPTFANNIKFFINYQLNWMYWRYFMWNFAGRQNDIQGHGNVIHGNWKSGLSFIDTPRLGDQNKLPDYLKNNKANNKYYMLPLLLGLLGLVYQLFKHLQDWWIVTLLFILTGIAIVVYLNQTPFQPRERDYAYAGSFYAFAIWIGLGVLAIYHLISKLGSKIVGASAAFLIAIPVPYIMAKENWDDHNRSKRFIARDFAYNYLMTCAPNAILFTYGDNDTFPIWYAQEVEGIRPDVKVCCLPYFASDWYIDQMKCASWEAAPMPLTLERSKYEPTVRDILYYAPISKELENNYISVDSLMRYIANDNLSSFMYQGDKVYSYHQNKLFLRVDSAKVVNNGTVKPENADKIEKIIKFDMNRKYLVKNEMMFLDLLRTNNWERPLYFTSIGSSNTVGLDNFFQNEGFAYRLVPIKSNSKGRIDVEIMYDNLMNKYKYGNMQYPDVYIDHTINRTTRIVKIRDNFRDLAILLTQQGDTVRAKEALAKCESLMPLNIYIPGIFDIDFAEAYYAIGDYEKGDNFLKEIVKVSEQELDFIYSLDTDKILRTQIELQMAMETYRRVVNMAAKHKRDELYNMLVEKFRRYMELYERI